MSKLEFNKEKIIGTLKEVIDADQILNINNISDEILIDLTTNNPTHKAKSDLTKKIIKTLKDNYNSNFNYKLIYNSRVHLSKNQLFFFFSPLNFFLSEDSDFC